MNLPFCITHHRCRQQLYVILQLPGSDHHKPNTTGERNAAVLGHKVLATAAELAASSPDATCDSAQKRYVGNSAGMIFLGLSFSN